MLIYFDRESDLWCVAPADNTDKVVASFKTDEECVEFINR